MKKKLCVHDEKKKELGILFIVKQSKVKDVFFCRVQTDSRNGGGH